MREVFLTGKRATAAGSDASGEVEGATPRPVKPPRHGPGRSGAPHELVDELPY
jgi:hypothetical protein